MSDSVNHQPISIAVVGHTNAGKTSLMRTLLRDARFGEVSHRPGTTRHVEGGELLLDGKPLIQLYDTPGLEDSIGLLEAIEQTGRESKDHLAEGRDRLTGFLEQLPDHTEFHQEAKVIRQLLNDDLIFYVIDIREPVLGKYKDELKIIHMAARPIIPVLNFVVEGRDHLKTWYDSLANLGLHAVIEFDTVIFNFDDERRLYQKMQALMAAHHQPLQRLIEFREHQWQYQLNAAKRTIAELIVNVAAYRKSGVKDQGMLSRYSQSLQNEARRAEQSCVASLLSLFNFDPKDVKYEELPVKDGAWEMDLFDPDNLKQFGLDAGSNAVKGAAVGVGIDAMTGGITLGAAALLGATAGFVWTAGRKYKDEIKNRLKGQQYLCVDESTLQVLWFRQKLLLDALQHRGHAAQASLDIKESSGESVPEDWKHWIKKARAHPEWSSLNPEFEPEYDRTRLELVQRIAGAFDTR